jgi:hypothetical protein
MFAATALRIAVGLALTAATVLYVSWGDFSWLVFSGPLAIEPAFSTLEGPGYTASPLLRCVILLGLCAALGVFLCAIPDLPRASLRGAPRWAAYAAAVYLAFAWLAGSFAWPAAPGSLGSAARVLSLLAFGALLIRRFLRESAGGAAAGPSGGYKALVIRLMLVFCGVCGLVTLLFGHAGWFGAEAWPYVFLRAGVVTSSLLFALSLTPTARESAT